MTTTPPILDSYHGIRGHEDPSRITTTEIHVTRFKESPIVRRMKMFQVLLNEKVARGSREDHNVVITVDTFTRRRQRRANRLVARKQAA